MEEGHPSPHLKKVLRSYQASAPNSLHGPNGFLGGPWAPPAEGAQWASSSAEKVVSVAVAAAAAAAGKRAAPESVDYDPFLAPPPFPIQQPPIFTPPDRSRCERSDTILEGETISCFVVGGEKRLCLPQILNTVLRDFSLQQINGVCDELHIFCSRCNPEQLDVLKVTGILPVSAPSCGLITKTDAERLCSALLHNNPPRGPEDEKRPFGFRVYHECFGKCVGICTPDWYTSPFSRCIECAECRGLFPPQKFVCHSHRSKENRTCHWGFDSANWRAYLLLAKGQNTKLQEKLDEVKARFDYTHKYKRKQKSVEEERPLTPSKRPRLEYPYQYPPALMPIDALAAYWYSSPWARMSAFKPWSPALTKDGKPLLVPLPAYLAESMPVYLSAGPALHPKLDPGGGANAPENRKCVPTGSNWCWPEFVGARGPEAEKELGARGPETFQPRLNNHKLC